MGFDYRRLRTGELVAGVCALLLLLDLFIAWYGIGVGAFSVTASAWEAFDVLDLFLALVALGTIALVVLTATQRSPALPVAGSVLVAAIGGFAALIVLYRILNQPGPNEFVDVKAGAYLGFLLCCGVAVGGFLALRDEGTTLAGARAQAEALVAERRTAHGTTTTPTAPDPPAPDPPAPDPSSPPPPASEPPPPGPSEAP